MKKLSVVFRVDASAYIGSGHVMRCLSLAEKFAVNCDDITFISREHDANLCDLIEKRGFKVIRLPPPPNKEILSDKNKDDVLHSSLLGVNWKKDADQTCNAIRKSGTKPVWMIVDHYSLDLRWESKVRSVVDNIMVIDDLADRQHDCDILLDQNLVVGMQERYRGKVPPECTLLLGPSYALLQDIYGELHEQVGPRKGKIKRILVFFGGADYENLTLRAIEALKGIELADIEVDIVMSGKSLNESEIKSSIREYPRFHLYKNLPTMASLMAISDLAIGASGTTSWERLCLGLPSVVITLAENQRAVADGLSRNNLAIWLGHCDEVSEEDIQSCILQLIQGELDEKWSRKCLETVDGKGTVRVYSIMTAEKNMPLNVRGACPSDENIILEWANDPITRLNAFSMEQISPKEHHRWFTGCLNNPLKCRIYIIETIDGVPFGQVRFERDGDSWIIDYSLAQPFRGRGLGKSILAAGLREFGSEYKDVRVVARVKKTNLKSCKVFESLNFDLSYEGDVMIYNLMLNQNSCSPY